MPSPRRDARCDRRSRAVPLPRASRNGRRHGRARAPAANPRDGRPTSSSSTSPTRSRAAPPEKPNQSRSAPLPRLILHRQRQPFAPGRDVGVVEARVEVALDLAPVPEPVAAPLAAHVDRRGELRRRRAAQSRAGGRRTRARAGAGPGRGASCGALRRSSSQVTSASRTRISRWSSIQSVRRESPALSVGSNSIPATCSIPARSRRIARRGRSITSCFRRSSSSGSEVHAITMSTRGRSSSGAAAARFRSRTRKPVRPSFGFQPSQPVVIASISTGWPISRAEHRRQVVTVRLDPREDDEAHRQQGEREDGEDRDQGDAGDPGQSEQCGLGLRTKGPASSADRA